MKEMSLARVSFAKGENLSSTWYCQIYIKSQERVVYFTIAHDASEVSSTTGWLAMVVRIMTRSRSYPALYDRGSGRLIPEKPAGHRGTRQSQTPPEQTCFSPVANQKLRKGHNIDMVNNVVH